MFFISSQERVISVPIRLHSVFPRSCTKFALLNCQERGNAGAQEHRHAGAQERWSGGTRNQERVTISGYFNDFFLFLTHIFVF